MMQALERDAAVFCMACICAELLSRFVGKGWGQKCIKTAAGLYILVVLTQTLSGAKGLDAMPAVPQPGAVSVGTAEEVVLAQTEKELAAALEAQCLQETGAAVSIEVTLVQTEDAVKAEGVCIRLTEEISADEKQEIADLLTEQLQISSESLVWETPGGEDVS